MTIIAEWVLHCSHCEAGVFKSVPLPKPKAGDALAWQQWFHMDGTPTHLGYPYICGTCCKWFQPMVEYLKIREDNDEIQK